MMSCPINIWSSSPNQEQLKKIIDYSGVRFAIEMVSNGYCYGVDKCMAFFN